VGCYTRAIPSAEQYLQTVVQRVHELSAGHASLVALLDYWSVWLGGPYAKALGQAHVDAASVADDVGAAINAVAAETGSAWSTHVWHSKALTTAMTQAPTWRLDVVAVALHEDDEVVGVADDPLDRLSFRAAMSSASAGSAHGLALQRLLAEHPYDLTAAPFWRFKARSRQQQGSL
jgi:hypothetical protein